MSSQNMLPFQERDGEKEHIFHCVLKCQIIRLVKNLGRHKHLLYLPENGASWHIILANNKSLKQFQTGHTTPV